MTEVTVEDSREPLNLDASGRPIIKLLRTTSHTVLPLKRWDVAARWELYVPHAFLMDSGSQTLVDFFFGCASGFRSAVVGKSRMPRA